MRVAIGQFKELTHEKLTFAKQLGVSGVQLNAPFLPEDDGYWHLNDLKWMVQRCEEYGLQLEALENVPRHFYDRAMLGLPGRDEQIANYQRTIRNMGEAGIPVLGYNWMPNMVWRTTPQPGRGGARVTAFNMTEVEAGVALTAGIADVTEGQVVDHDQMWANYRYFMDAVLPVAEEAGVRLALHPDDPPVPELGGVARLFYRPEGFKRALEVEGVSDMHGLDFCMGCFSEMLYDDDDSGKGALDAMRYFGERGKLFYIHFRDVQGCVPNFQECFLGEGNVDVVAAMLVLKEVGFDGFIIDDHVPLMIDDTQWHHRGRAHATGYIQGLMEAVKRLG